MEYTLYNDFLYFCLIDFINLGLLWNGHLTIFFFLKELSELLCFLAEWML